MLFDVQKQKQCSITVEHEEEDGSRSPLWSISTGDCCGPEVVEIGIWDAKKEAYAQKRYTTVKAAMGELLSMVKE